MCELRQCGRVCQWIQTWSTLLGEVESDAVVPDQLPRLTKASVWPPSPSKPTEALLVRLDAQNSELQTKDWFIIYRQSRPQGTFLAMSIGKDSVEYLRAWKDPVYFLDHLIDVRMQRS